MFPMDDSAAITGFRCTLDGRDIEGEVKPSEEASKIYEEAVRQNKSAFLVEEDKPDVFKVGIVLGNYSAFGVILS